MIKKDFNFNCIFLQKRLCCAAKKALSKIPVRSLKTDDRVSGFILSTLNMNET